MKTKAETIKILQKNSKKLGIIVLDFLYTEVKNFKKNKIFFLNQINKKFKYKPIIIRSSSKNEDTRKFTNAGKYDSIILKKYLINKALFCGKSMRSHPFLENFQIHINHLPQNLHRLLETYLSPYYAKYSFFCFQFP